jgi:hypothetical protein
MRKVRLIIATLLAVGGFTAIPAIAQARDYGLGFGSMHMACYEQYAGRIWISGGAAFDYRGNWYCTKNFHPLGPVLGGINIQQYCSTTYPGSRAIYRGWGPLSCARSAPWV